MRRLCTNLGETRPFTLDVRSETSAVFGNLGLDLGANGAHEAMVLDGDLVTLLGRVTVRNVVFNVGNVVVELFEDLGLVDVADVGEEKSWVDSAGRVRLLEDIAEGLAMTKLGFQLVERAVVARRVVREFFKPVLCVAGGIFHVVAEGLDLVFNGRKLGESVGEREVGDERKGDVVVVDGVANGVEV